MDEYTVKITSQAENHIQEIIHYITNEIKAPEAALYRFFGKFFYITEKFSAMCIINRHRTMSHKWYTLFICKEFSCIFLDK